MLVAWASSLMACTSETMGLTSPSVHIDPEVATQLNGSKHTLLRRQPGHPAGRYMPDEYPIHLGPDQARLKGQEARLAL